MFYRNKHVIVFGISISSKGIHQSSLYFKFNGVFSFTSVFIFTIVIWIVGQITILHRRRQTLVNLVSANKREHLFVYWTCLNMHWTRAINTHGKRTGRSRVTRLVFKTVFLPKLNLVENFGFIAIGNMEKRTKNEDSIYLFYLDVGVHQLRFIQRTIVETNTLVRARTTFIDTNSVSIVSLKTLLTTS